MKGIIATIRIKPGTADDFEKVFLELREAVKANEPGNLYYDIFRSDEENAYVVMENYVDAAAQEAHGKSEHFRTIGAKMGPFMAGPPEIKRLDMVK